MVWGHTDYDPKRTETFRSHFGSPEVVPLPSPTELFWRDLGTLVQKSYLIFDVAKPFFTRNPNDELYLGSPDGPASVWFTVWSLVQAPLTLAIIVFTVITTGIVELLSNIYTFLFWRQIQGPSFQVYPDTPPPRYNPRQRWIFINGIAVGKTTLRQELAVLSQTFHAPVLGINNRTYGFLGDLVECVLQRDVNWQTEETRIAEPIIKTYLEDRENVDKVILVAHSQGGIIASNIIKALFSEVAWENIHDRLEVYTFGSAALDFPNPWLDNSHSQRLVTHMEHYCNEKDLVTQFGALSSVDRGDRYHGRVFVAKGRTGHMLNQHYLSHMFPGPNDQFLEQKAVRDETILNKYVVSEGDGFGGKTVRDLSNLWTYME